MIEATYKIIKTEFAFNRIFESFEELETELFDYGRKIAKNQHSELVIHNTHGRIRDKDSYDNDNCPPKDTKF